eukprot:1149933-Pelagomonas_calceolata.AAC.2
MGQAIIVLLGQLPAGEGVWSGVRSCLASNVSTVPASKLQRAGADSDFLYLGALRTLLCGQGRIPQAYPQCYLTASFLAPAVSFPTPAAAAGHAPGLSGLEALSATRQAHHPRTYWDRPAVGDAVVSIVVQRVQEGSGRRDMTPFPLLLLLQKRCRNGGGVLPAELHLRCTPLPAAPPKPHFPHTLEPLKEL